MKSTIPRSPFLLTLMREAALPAVHGLPGRCFASATAFRNGLNAI